MKFCIYSGTFNPIHTAHLIVAQTVKDTVNADKMLLIPSFIPPHRDEEEIISAEHRLEMLKRAVSNNPDFEVSDIELQLKGKSYSYLTIKKLYELYPEIDERINFIIGTDAFEKVESWYKAEELVKLVKFLVVPRDVNYNFEALFDKIKLSGLQVESVDVPFSDISSSGIRERIKKGKSIKYYVVREVEEYIKENNLYGN